METIEVVAGPFQLGYDAWEEGLSIIRCPFNQFTDTTRWNEWMRGYKSSMHDNPSLNGDINEEWDR